MAGQWKPLTFKKEATVTAMATGSSLMKESHTSFNDSTNYGDGFERLFGFATPASISQPSISMENYIPCNMWETQNVQDDLFQFVHQLQDNAKASQASISSNPNSFSKQTYHQQSYMSFEEGRDIGSHFNYDDDYNAPFSGFNEKTIKSRNDRKREIKESGANHDPLINCILSSMHHLSGLLPSDIDATELSHHQKKLMQLVIDNLGAFAARNKKGVADISCQDSSPNFGNSSFTGSKNNFIMRQNTVDTRSIPLNMKVDELDQSNVSFSNLNDDAAQVYRKLWLDAETKLCVKKYEHQVAQMKIDGENNIADNEESFQVKINEELQTDRRAALSVMEHQLQVVETKKYEIQVPETKLRGKSPQSLEASSLTSCAASDIKTTVQDQKLTIPSDFGQKTPQIENMAPEHNDESEKDQSSIDSDCELCSCTPESTSDDKDSSASSEWEYV